MKIYMITDLEGPAMVSRWTQTRDCTDESPAKQEAKRLLTGEVNAAVDGVLDVAPEADVIVWDAHGNGGIDLSSFHPRARLITRGPIKAPYYLDDTFDGLFFVGQHAMAGTPNAPLCHTFSSKSIEYYKINGELVGEFGARAMLAGSFGVPTIFISGDDQAIAEARALVPAIVCAEVKQGLGIELALHLSPIAARELIRRQAAEAIRQLPTIPPYVVAPPYEQEIRVYEGVSIEPYLARGGTRLDDRTVRLTADRLTDLCV